MAKSPRPQLSVTQATRIFKLLADDHRLHLVLLLAGRGEMNVTALTGEVGMPQPAISHHLTLLRMGGVVDCRRSGKNNFYSLASDAARDLIGVVKF